MITDAYYEGSYSKYTSKQVFVILSCLCQK